MTAMYWGDVMFLAILPILSEDDALATLLQNADQEPNPPPPGPPYIYPAQASRPVRVPSVEWVIVGDSLTEVFNPITVQFDWWAKGVMAAEAIERRLRILLHRNVRRRIAGIDLATTFMGGRSHGYRDPGIVHWSNDYLFEPVRARYVVRNSP